jgi:hypothetical protein
MPHSNLSMGGVLPAPPTPAPMGMRLLLYSVTPGTASQIINANGKLGVNWWFVQSLSSLSLNRFLSCFHRACGTKDQPHCMANSLSYQVNIQHFLVTKDQQSIRQQLLQLPPQPMASRLRFENVIAGLFVQFKIVVSFVRVGSISKQGVPCRSFLIIQGIAFAPDYIHENLVLFMAPFLVLLNY